jgi:hypothetical protein
MAALRPENAHTADANNFPLLGPARPFIADASVAHALNAVFSDTEAEAALNALGVKINTILDVLEEHGFMKAS